MPLYLLQSRLRSHGVAAVRGFIRAEAKALKRVQTTKAKVQVLGGLHI
ncbi:hypothetical protein P4233_11050 [Pseudomonas aeruginosa]|nr:hypothetical protein [Pseudomonas aeruginosa]